MEQIDEHVLVGSDALGEDEKTRRVRRIPFVWMCEGCEFLSKMPILGKPNDWGKLAPQFAWKLHPTNTDRQPFAKNKKRKHQQHKWEILSLFVAAALIPIVVVRNFDGCVETGESSLE